MTKFAALYVCLALVPVSLTAAPFTAGNIVVYRVGTGSSSLTNSSTAVSLDEYTPSGTFVQSVSMPTAGTPFTESGSATNAGMMTRSADGAYIVMAGYFVTPGTATVASSTTSIAPRAIGRVDAAGNATVAATMTGSNLDSVGVRSAASADGVTNFWFTGNGGASLAGLSVAAPGANTSVPTLAALNIRSVAIFDGQLYFSTGSATLGSQGVYAMGTGLPTSGSPTATLIAAVSNPNQFFFADLSPSEAGLDTLYVINDTSSVGLHKFTKQSGVWSQTGSTVALGSPAASHRGLTGVVSGTTVTLYATTVNALNRYVDNGGYAQALSGTFTALATAATNTAFRGVALAPVAASTPISATGSATSVTAGGSTTFSGTVTPATGPTSTGIAVSCNLTTVGGSSSYALTVTGSTISGTYAVPALTTANTYSLPCTVSDAQSRSANFNISLTVTSGSTPPTASASATTTAAGSSTTFSGAISPGTNPASTSLAVACNLTGVGGASNYALTVTGTTISGSFAVGSGVTPNAYVLPCTVSDGQARSSAFNVSLTVTAAPLTCGASKTLIGAIQGSGASSTMAGQIVTIEGTVTGVFQGSTRLNGFYIQDEGDGSSTTSDGIFIDESSGSLGAVTTGSVIRLQGTVAETFSQTVINSVSQRISCGSGTVTPTDVTLPAATTTSLEAFEGMLVRFPQQLRVTDNYNLGRFGEVGLALVPSYGDGVTYTRLMQGTQVAAPGAAATSAADLNTRSRIILDDGSNQTYGNLAPTATWPLDGGGLSATNTLRLGDRVNVDANGVYTPLVAVLGFGFSAYRLHPVTGHNITFGPSDNPRPAAPPAVGGRVTVMSANVLNYFTTYNSRGANDETEFLRQRDKIINVINTANPAVVALGELENNATAAINNLVNGALPTFTNSLNAATPGKWAYIDTGVVGTDDIRVGFLYQPALVQPVGTHQVLQNAAALVNRNRPAIAQTFRRLGTKSELQHFTVVANHFKSKGSACTSAPSDPDLSDGQGNCNLSRVSIARALLEWLAANPTGDPTPAADRRFLIVGDLNAYAKEDPISALTSTTFTKGVSAVFPSGLAASPLAVFSNLVPTLGDKAGYSYLFSGQSGALDHALANPALFRQVTGVAEWHINADEPVVLDYNSDFDGNDNSSAKSGAQIAAYYTSGAFRASDHDPLLVGFNPLLGDFDDDGDVDSADQTFIRSNIGRALTSANRRCDFDLDGRITLTDFQRWSSYAAAFQR